MNLVLQKAFLCCVLSTLLPSTRANPLNRDDLKRLSDWLQGEVWREVRSASLLHEDDSTSPPLEQNSDTESYVPQHRSLRSKRTEPAYSVKRIEKAGCNLATCSVHELAHLLHIMRTKMNNAPPDKIGSKGYGRRRRRSLPPTHPTFDEGRLKLALLQNLKRHKGVETTTTSPSNWIILLSIMCLMNGPEKDSGRLERMSACGIRRTPHQLGENLMFFLKKKSCLGLRQYERT
nr:pro-adrenomedullin isoform X1 [Misgurnus anguillicaudatus]